MTSPATTEATLRWRRHELEQVRDQIARVAAAMVRLDDAIEKLGQAVSAGGAAAVAAGDVLGSLQTRRSDAAATLDRLMAQAAAAFDAYVDCEESDAGNAAPECTARSQS